mmetsp:Transcript_29158/g.68699  ORF Transcript_29158/g.68699 Transcript_29158/m.68699 type:complete len:389 (-) Transcript_29158:122-1288(-)
MACFLELEDPAIPELCRYIDTLESSSGKETTACYDAAAGALQDERYIDVLKIVNGKLEVLLAQPEEREAEESFYIVCSLVQRAQSDAAVIDEFVSKLTAGSTHQMLRLKILSSVFSILEAHPKSQLTVLSALVSQATKTGQFHNISSQLERVDSLLEGWKADKADARKLHLVISQAAKQADKPLQAHEFLLKHLSTFQGGSKAELDQASGAAKDVVVDAIAQPTVFHFDKYLQLDAVRHLENGGEKAVLGLLGVFAREDVAGLAAFDKANPNLLKTLGLEQSACMEKMRLLSLCSLASKEEEVGYSQLASKMDVPEAEVERWVIKAISAKLIDAKMDQLRRVVIVKGSTDREFGQAQWGKLHGKLSAWETNVQQLLEVIRTARTSVEQ